MLLMPLLIVGWLVVFRAVRNWKTTLAKQAEELVEVNQSLDQRVVERTEALLYEIAERKQVEEKLRQKMDQLERFNRLTQGRELRIIEMKREVNEMADKAGVAPPYDLAFLEQWDRALKHGDRAPCASVSDDGEASQ